MPIEVRDSGVNKIVQGVWAQENGTDKEVQEVIISDGGTDKLVFDESNPFDVSNLTFEKSFSIGTGLGVNLAGTEWNDDGTQMYVVKLAATEIVQYDLSTAFDVGTASFSKSLDLSSQMSRPTGMTWNNNGTRLYVAETVLDGFGVVDGGFIYQYSLATAYDIATTTFEKSIDVSSEDLSAQDVSFNDNGTKMYVVGEIEDKVFQYHLTTADDIGTASLEKSFNYNRSDFNDGRGMAWNNDGTQMYISSSFRPISQYNLTTAFDVSTAGFVDSFDVKSEDDNPEAVTWSNDGTKLYIAGNENSDIYQYTI